MAIFDLQPDSFSYTTAISSCERNWQWTLALLGRKNFVNKMLVGCFCLEIKLYKEIDDIYIYIHIIQICVNTYILFFIFIHRYWYIHYFMITCLGSEIPCFNLHFHTSFFVGWVISFLWYMYCARIHVVGLGKVANSLSLGNYLFS